MRVRVESNDVAVSDEELSAVDAAVTARASAWSRIANVRDLRLRLVRTKSALLCVAAVGLSGGGLVTSTAESSSPLDAMVGALDELPGRFDRLESARRESAASSPTDAHAMVREELRRLLG